MNFNSFLPQILSSMVLLISVRTVSGEDCVDKVTNCRSYGSSVCGTYQDWAKLNCAFTCAFCTGPPPKRECEDNRDDCDKYVAEICTASSWKVWAEDNCSKFCGFCVPTTDAVTSPTTITASTSTQSVSPTDATKSSTMTTVSTSTATTPCVDGLNFCMVYSRRACTDATWAEKYCKKYCSRC